MSLSAEGYRYSVRKLDANDCRWFEWGQKGLISVNDVVILRTIVCALTTKILGQEAINHNKKINRTVVLTFKRTAAGSDIDILECQERKRARTVILARIPAVHWRRHTCTHCAKSKPSGLGVST